MCFETKRIVKICLFTLLLAGPAMLPKFIMSPRFPFLEILMQIWKNFRSLENSQLLRIKKEVNFDTVLWQLSFESNNTFLVRLGAEVSVWPKESLFLQRGGEWILGVKIWMAEIRHYVIMWSYVLIQGDRHESFQAYPCRTCNGNSWNWTPWAGLPHHFIVL